MKSETLARELREIARRGGGFGTETEAALMLLADALEANPGKTVSQLTAKLKPRVRSTAAPKSTTFDTPAEGIVAEFVTRLQGAGSASDALDVFKELSLSGRKARVSVVQAKEIAGRFLGAKIKFASKAEALGAIKERLDRKDWDRGVLQSIRDRTSF